MSFRTPRQKPQLQPTPRGAVAPSNSMEIISDVGSLRKSMLFQSKLSSSKTKTIRHYQQNEEQEHEEEDMMVKGMWSVKLSGQGHSKLNDPSSVIENVNTRTTIPHSTIPNSTIPHSTIPHSAIPHSAIPHSTIPHSTIPNSTIPHSTIPNSTIPHSAIQPNTIQPNTIQPNKSFSNTCNVTINQQFIYKKRPPSTPIYSPFTYVHDTKRHSHQPSPTPYRTLTFDSPLKQYEIFQNDQFDVQDNQHEIFENDQYLCNNGQENLETQLKTLIVYQPGCLDHHTGSHQENRKRLCQLCGENGILRSECFCDLMWAPSSELQEVELADILRVHDYEYIQHVENLCNQLPDQSLDSNPTTDAIQEENPVSSKSLFEATGNLDNDSPISKMSFVAAKLAAGAVCYAVDQLMSKSCRNAFVAIRPPGHHAGPRGCVSSANFAQRPEMCSSGFCLLNNVAIGAAYAMSKYSPSYGGNSVFDPIDKIAIIDFDVHHGNGTESIINNLIPHRERYPLPESWAPVDFFSYKPWRNQHDSDRVFFGSVHVYDGCDFYPCSGESVQNSKNRVNVNLDPLGPKYVEGRQKMSLKQRNELMKQGSICFRNGILEELLPRLDSFQPDIIFISAGFDAHADDFYYYLNEDDFIWITEKLKEIAIKHAKGRIISVLEGGYNVDAPVKKGRKSNRFHSETTKSSEFSIYGSLARSCAAHVKSLQS